MGPARSEPQTGFVCVYIYLCVCVYVSVFICLCAYMWCVCLCVFICRCAYMLCVRVHMRVCMYVCVYMCVCVCVCIYVVCVCCVIPWAGGVQCRVVNKCPQEAGLLAPSHCPSKRTLIQAARW